MKSRRQLKIHELIRDRAVKTQDELAQLLRQEGIEVTQATVSRDIKELKLVKVPSGDGGYRYSLPAESGGGDQVEKLRRYMIDAVVSIDYAKNLVLIKCLPGTANAVAVIMDKIRWSEVVGTVAGDDTILVILREEQAVELFVAKLRSLMR
ncbi:MAG: arginine repressor [Bacillota bacterium]|nr:arginine repressor [Bacillota bacterium]